MRDIAKNIRTLRNSKNITQDELAEKLFVTRQTVSNYETGKSRPDIDMLIKIADVLETDMQQLIYGPELPAKKIELRRLGIGAGLSGMLLLLWFILAPIAQKQSQTTYLLGFKNFLVLLIYPLFFIITGWTLMQLVAMALKWNGFTPNSAKWVRRILLSLIIIWFVVTFLYCAVMTVEDWMFYHRIKGEWIVQSSGTGWSRQSEPLPKWLEKFNLFFLLLAANFPLVYLLPGALLRLCGFPASKIKPD